MATTKIHEKMHAKKSIYLKLMAIKFREYVLQFPIPYTLQKLIQQIYINKSTCYKISVWTKPSKSAFTYECS